MDDIRRKPVTRRLVLKIADYTQEPFTQRDLDWIEDILQQKFDVIVESIDIQTAKESS